MPDLEARRVVAAITGPEGEPVGEARLWAAGNHGPEGGWSGWLYAADAGGQLPPGRYTLIGDGWSAAIDVPTRPLSRVFETDLQLFTGAGGLPWPATGTEPAPARTERPADPPWQAAEPEARESGPEAGAKG